ncbi:hypothetical protein L1987_25399 [Smallanthus sonchifolius]|uniref:Uncharacterized protein n=1 Tax=Smallanthus sonchifolius TaxID=185202 RepID=A0ACB9IQT9_9ASTR|nr:hypothetical protein L1987_25399 [Smallanthus sonchifolius]
MFKFANHVGMHLGLAISRLWWSAETITVVTGANQGIGFQIAHQLGLHGLTVALISRETAVGEESAIVLQEGGLKVVFHQLDVIDQESIDRYVLFLDKRKLWWYRYSDKQCRIQS